MTIAHLLAGMIARSAGDLHDIDHMIRVWTYAKTIGELEGLDPETQFILEAAAVTHDIACPLCRRKYGSANGKLQEKESPPLVRDFLAGSGMTAAQTDRVAFLAGHHHTFTGIDGPDYQILLEADYIANAAENGFSTENIRHFEQTVMKTRSGRQLLRDIFCQAFRD